MWKMLVFHVGDTAGIRDTKYDMSRVNEMLSAASCSNPPCWKSFYELPVFLVHDPEYRL